MGRNGKKTGRNRKKREKRGRNGTKWEEMGRNGKRKKTNNSIDDNKIMQPLWRGRTRKQTNKKCDI